MRRARRVPVARCGVMRTPVVMTHVPHERGVAAAPPRTVRAPDGPCLSREEPAGWSSVVPIPENHNPQDA